MHAAGMPMGGLLDRVATAPISWGVSEVPGWGHQMSAGRVLDEMRRVGITATEFGPLGFLPGAPADKARLLADHGMRAVGGFCPVVLHDPATNPDKDVSELLDGFTATGADSLVLAAATGADGYDTRPALAETGWATLLDNLERLRDLAGERGVVATLHPHVGTMIEGREEVWRVLEHSTIPLCLDTGHLLVAGTDPVEIAAQAPERVAHTHLKDVHVKVARTVQSGELAFADAVGEGVFCPLGGGDVDMRAIVGHLEAAGYSGWYVLEQDTRLDGDPPAGSGPMQDVRASLEYLSEVAQ